MAVCDSSVWIFLAKLGLAEHAISLFDKTIVPNTVHEEIAVRNDQASAALATMLSGNRVEIMSARNERFVNALRRRLGRGESESIVVALDINADVVLLDDHAARTIALQLGLSVKGTLGIIRKLMQLGQYNVDLKDLYEHLKSMGFWVNEELYWKIFSDLA